MKLFVLSAAAVMAGVRADPHTTDPTPVHWVYNCEGIRQNVDEANAMIGDGVCNPEVNCGPYSYDLGDCWESTDDICMGDSWYENGRDNFRCSTKTGGRRFARYGNNDDTGVAQSGGWPGACDCYAFCLEKADAENETLTVFDNYSGKCRCWTTDDDGGECTYDDALPCRDGGDDYGVGSPNNGGNGNPDEGNNWRCPSEIYFPEPMTDCDGNDITFHYYNLEQYLGDGFCDNGDTDNQMFAFEDSAVEYFNLNCSKFEYDGGDCTVDCHNSVYWATSFVDLGSSFERVDECAYGEPDATTAFTTVCDCYEFCAGEAADDHQKFLFDHDHRDNCRCWLDLGGSEAMLSNLEETTFCGLNSDCQIYQPNRRASCSGIDYTLGVFDGTDTYDADGVQSDVTSFDDWVGNNCVEDAMCEVNGYSYGSCFDCSRFSTDGQQESYCTDETSYYAQISNTDLQALVDDGYLSGASDEDSSLGGDNCACLNYCFSKAVEDDVVDESEDFYDMLNVIAEIDFAYATRNETCTCFQDCPTTTSCGANCPDTVWHSTVADLNTQQ